MGNNFRKASFKESVSEVPNKALVIANDFESPFSIPISSNNFRKNRKKTIQNSSY